MSLNRWHYFLNLERDFVKTIEYVEFDQRNSLAFSNEHAKILFMVASLQQCQT